jgi:UPF0716 protein FxsA
VPLLFLLFTVVPVLELWLLLRIGGEIGAAPTIAMLVVTGVAGSWLAKREGRRVLQGWRRAVAEGRAPEEGILSGALVLAGGVLLVSPGVLTDVVGVALLFPPTRRLAARALRRVVERRIARGSIRVFRTGGGFPPEARRGEVIDVTPRDRDGSPR